MAGIVSTGLPPVKTAAGGVLFELLAKDTRKVRGGIKAGAAGDVGQRQAGLHQQPPGLFETGATHILLRGLAGEAYQGDEPSPGYWDGVRQLCDQRGAVFIFDEVKTGFRFALGGAQEVFGIQPDLATFGKTMCNSYPGSVVVGKRAILEPRSDTFIGATFHGDLLSIAAVRATIGLLRERDGIAYIARLGRRLMGGLNEVFQKRGYPLRVRGWPAMPELAQVDNPPLDLAGKVLTEWCVAMQRRGFYMTGHCWFISLAHTVDDIERTVAVGGKAVTEVLATITRQPVASATLATGCGEIVFVLRVEG